MTALVRAVSIEEQRHILLELLRTIDQFCRDHGLTYYLYAGTLLGAVRHGGFIPWDDDIDLMMPRADYEELCQLFPRAGGTYLATADTHPGFPYAYAKVCRAGTIMHEHVTAGALHFGVNVDVFPLDPTSRGHLAWASHRGLALVGRALLLAKVVQPRPELPAAICVGLQLAQFLMRAVPTRLLTQVRTRIATLCSRKPSSYVGMLVVDCPWRLVTADLFPPTLTRFENLLVPVPRKPAALLSQKYGDFMTLPPESSRVPPHSSTAYWITDDPFAVEPP